MRFSIGSEMPPHLQRFPGTGGLAEVKLCLTVMVYWFRGGIPAVTPGHEPRPGSRTLKVQGVFDGKEDEAELSEQRWSFEET